MLSIRCIFLSLLSVWALQCSAIQKNQTLLAVKRDDNRITVQPKLYIVKPKEIIIGKAKYIDRINSTGYVYIAVDNKQL